jgi:hypothetical protein
MDWDIKKGWMKDASGKVGEWKEVVALPAEPYSIGWVWNGLSHVSMMCQGWATPKYMMAACMTWTVHIPTGFVLGMLGGCVVGYWEYLSMSATQG